MDTRLDRLEEALSRLAEAQARTAEWAERVELALAQLAEAQTRTEERVGQLEVRMERVELALAQLAEAQARTEERVGRLEEAQVRTEAAVQSLAQQVGRLGDTIGFTLEDLAREVTPAYLAQHYGIQVPQLDRHFLFIDDQELEIDFYGEGRRDAEPITIIGEVRSRIYGGDVEEAVRRAARLAPLLPSTPLIVLFGFVIHPSAREVAKREGAIVISSSGR